MPIARLVLGTLCLVLCRTRYSRNVIQRTPHIEVQSTKHQVQIGDRQLKIGNDLNRRLTMGEHAQQTVDAQMQQQISDERNYQRHHQGVTTVRARAGNYSSKGFVERIRHGDDETNEPGATLRREQSQQKPQSQQRIENKKEVIDDL